MSATVSARQAATLCNVSLTSVQRWIAAGKLRADMVDGAYQINVADLEPFRRRHGATVSPDTDATVEADTPPDTVQRGADDTGATSPDEAPGVAELTRLVREQAQRLEHYAGQIGFLTAQLQAAQEQIVLLTAPAPPTSGQGRNVADSAPQPVSEPGSTLDPADPSGDGHQSVSDGRTGEAAATTGNAGAEPNGGQAAPWWQFWKWLA